MDLLEFARGPGLLWALAIMVFGIAWRLVAILLLQWRSDLSAPRSNRTMRGAVRLMIMRSWPHKEFLPKTWFSELAGWTFHLGFFAVLLLFVPHILFIEGILGISWPGLPNWLIYALGVVTVFALLGVLVRRLRHPVLRLLSNFDDYFSWLVTIAPVATGLTLSAYLGMHKETLLAVHLLSVELLMVWFPFSKLMHAFFIWASRGITGAAFARKGISPQ